MSYKGRAPFLDADYVRGQSNITHVDLDLSSGLVDYIVRVPGDLLYLDQQSTGFAFIEPNTAQAGQLSPLLVSAGFSLEMDFASLKINASAQLNKRLRLIIGNGIRIRTGGNVNPSSNSINMVDGAKLRTENESAFMGHVPVAAGGVGTYSHAQIWNPAGSGKNVFLERIAANSTVAGTLFFTTDTTIATTAYGSNFPAKKVGNTFSVAQRRYDIPVALGLAGGKNLATRVIPANGGTELILKEPVMLPPGTGCTVIHSVANTAVNSDWEFFEE